MKKSCFLFGNADAPQSIYSIIERHIELEFIEGNEIFYVGYHGKFDRLASLALQNAKKKHPMISAYLVLSYHPTEKQIDLPTDFDGFFYPPIEEVPRRFAIVRANRYMIENVDTVLCYVDHPGNSRNLLEYALRKKKKVINISDSIKP
ncbi:MAG: hypothetical protein IJB92_01900 [Clostridia bacterium]|nr:hypothetical protein [Clostridia bacterium]